MFVGVKGNQINDQEGNIKFLTYSQFCGLLVLSPYQGKVTDSGELIHNYLSSTENGAMNGAICSGIVGDDLCFVVRKT